MGTIDRRIFLTLAAASGLAHIPGALPSAFAADPYALAKQQGKAVFYANITAVSPIMKAFEKATGVKGEYTRTSSSKFLPTLHNEFTAGTLLADVVQAPLQIGRAPV